MDRRRQIVALLMSITPPPDHNGFIEYVHLVLVTIICRSPPSLNIKQRLFSELDIYFQGRDVLASRIWLLWNNWRNLTYVFFLLNEIRLPGSERVLSKENKLLLVFLWLRSYPSYHFLSTLFNISVSTVKELIKLAIPILDNHFDMLVGKLSKSVAEIADGGRCYRRYKPWSLQTGTWPKTILFRSQAIPLHS